MTVNTFNFIVIHSCFLIFICMSINSHGPLKYMAFTTLFLLIYGSFSFSHAVSFVHKKIVYDFWFASSNFD